MTTFTYDTVGRRARVEFPNGTRALYGYDAAGRLTGLTHQTSAGATLEQFRYTYNAAGERTTVTTLAQTASYGYDLVGRLTGVTAAPTGPQPSEVFTYDAVGNRLTGPTAAQGYSYNAGHQLLTGPTAQYAYDLNGNRTQKIDPLATRTYTWDAQDRLRQAVVSTAIGTATVTMAYDHRGRRVRKTVTGSSSGRSATATIDYVYDEDDIILIVTTLQVAGGLPQTTMTRVVHGPDVDEPLWLEQGGRLAVLHADGLGSIALASDATQIVVERTTYTPFGVPARKGSAGVQPFAFTGREWDVELGLYYYRARYYDPKVGRFLSRDPLGLAAGPNPYTYVENSPTNYLDPSGQIVDICRSMRPWNDQCFVSHYWRGFGRTVDVIEVGLLQALRAAKGTKLALQATQARIQAEAVRQAKTLCDDCDKGSKPFTFGTGREESKRNFTDEPGLFVYGKGPLFTGSTCSGIANCATRTCSFDCEISVDVPDEFSDPFSFRERYGTPVEVGIPYALKARWVEQWAGAVGF
jgi:RHS repeat-associated protein